jgi:acyl-coenzyme A synthetase/AMP-(fatty) acid ligase
MRKLNWYLPFVLALAMLFVGGVEIGLSAQETQEKLSPQQLKELIAKAKAPADHEKIAAYYRAESVRLKQDAEVHRDDAGINGKGQGAIHCTNLAKLDEQAAKEADSLASMHENMAKAAH